MTTSEDPLVDVLLVEDDDDDAAVVERLLRTSRRSRSSDRMIEVGSIDRATDVATALEAIESRAPTAVLLDLGLPDSDGLETVRSVVDTAPRVAVVVLTGRTERDLGPDAIRAGAQDYLTKGRITEEVLRRSLRYAIDRHETQLAIQDANRRLELLNRILRQDIRNDVSAILGWGGELRSTVGDDAIERVDRLVEAAEHAAELADAASELVDALSVDGQIEPEPVPLASVLVPEIQRLRDREDVDLAVDRTGLDESVVVRGTPMLSSAFEQLLTNAVRHTTRDRARVSVGVDCLAETVEVSVADDGLGMSDAQKEALNDPETRYLGRSGIGTGLYLVTNVLEQVDGEFEFADSYPRGTEVTVTLQRTTEST